jgi:hypothetical protein
MVKTMVFSENSINQKDCSVILCTVYVIFDEFSRLAKRFSAKKYRKKQKNPFFLFSGT